MSNELKLTPYSRTKYSAAEKMMFDLIPKDGTKIRSSDLVHKRLMHGEWDVANPQNIITVTMNNLIRKISTNGEKFKVMKDGKRVGHHVVEYYVEKRR